MIKASRKRLLLSVYIDFLFYTSVIYIAGYWLALSGHKYGGAEKIAFVFSVLLWKKKSLGRVFLGISDDYYLSEDLKNRETFLLMALATIFVLDGTKQIVRWTQFSAWPFFGFIPESFSYVAISFLSGGLSILAGFWLYKLDIRGLYLSAVIVLMQLFSMILSHEYFNGVIAQKIIERRAIQGIAVREGEVEFLQQFLTPAIIIFAGLFLLILFFYRKRFYKVQT
jgi:hypothetical protein